MKSITPRSLRRISHCLKHIAFVLLGVLRGFPRQYPLTTLQYHLNKPQRAQSKYAKVDKGDHSFLCELRDHFYLANFAVKSFIRY